MHRSNQQNKPLWMTSKLVFYEPNSLVKLERIQILGEYCVFLQAAFIPNLISLFFNPKSQQQLIRITSFHEGEKEKLLLNFFLRRQLTCWKHTLHIIRLRQIIGENLGILLCSRYNYHHLLTTNYYHHYLKERDLRSNEQCPLITGFSWKVCVTLVTDDADSGLF